MTTAAIRERLYDIIRVADDKKIEAIYNLLGDQITPVTDWSEDEEFVAELDERVRRFDEGIDRGHTWEELEQSIEELKQKRAEK
jgi:recombinational DNA repair protein RecR